MHNTEKNPASPPFVKVGTTRNRGGLGGLKGESKDG